MTEFPPGNRSRGPWNMIPEGLSLFSDEILFKQIAANRVPDLVHGPRPPRGLLRVAGAPVRHYSMPGARCHVPPR